MTIQQAFELALHHHQNGRLVEAEAIYRQILAVDPSHADALHLLGIIVGGAGRHDLAVQMIRQAIALVPDSHFFHSNLGNELRELGHRDEAIAEYRRALEIAPGYADAQNNLGTALLEQGQLDEAIACFRRALELNPKYAAAHSNLGNALRDRGRLDDAIGAHRAALRIEPGVALTHNSLGIALAERGLLDEAIAAYRRALELQPNYPQAHSNLGAALKQNRKLEAAVAAYREALWLNPNFADAHFNLANALWDMGLLDPAIAGYRRALQLKPNYAEARSNLLLALHYVSGLDPESIFREHRTWGELHARPLEENAVPHANDPSPERRLRIGYVSPDFRLHSVASFFENLLTNHDRAEVEVFCYSNLLRSDSVTERLRMQAAHWREISELNDAQAAELIRRDQIDILIDLAGHTSRNRLLTFAHRPAPVQVTYLGYCDTTGLKTMDYRLTDAHADPPGMTEHFHSEELVRLQAGAWCYRPFEEAPTVNAPPVLRTGSVTFGSFNALPKVTDVTVLLWTRILRDVPNSRLLLKNPGLQDPSVHRRLRNLVEKEGISPERLELLGHLPSLSDHLSTYQRVDIALDTFPYHGTTTTCEALWMGVPVVSLAGKTHASRVGVSLLSTVGLPELVASSENEYLHLAVKLANDLPRLTKLRQTLRHRMQDSPLMDGPRLARGIEAAYREMWRKRWAAAGCLLEDD
ncbi:MAG: tetratricopeptide repeat protein [Chthoniobacteraceae bacterium]